MEQSQKQFEVLDPWTFSFGGLLNLAIKMDTQLDKALKPYDLTAKQWYLLMVLNYMLDGAPTLSQAAKEAGSSYQNIKQVALKLEAKGYITLEKDEKDARMIRLRRTEKIKTLERAVGGQAEAFMKQFYEGVSDEEIGVMKRIIFQLLSNVERMNLIQANEAGD